MARSRYEYVNPANWVFLTVLRLWASGTAFFFFRQFRVTGLENIPKDMPVIFAVNHQSAFLDPILIGISCGRKPWYLTRSGVFKNRVVRFLLHAIHMLPVFRNRDGVNVKDANRSTFDMCRRILAGNGSILIFPEGNHGMLKHLRIPLRKGFARIALETLARMPETSDIAIVPVGINYEHPTRFRTDVLVRYGRPLLASDALASYRENASEGLRALTAQLEKRMEFEMINISPLNEYEQTEARWLRTREKPDDLVSRFMEDKKLTSGKVVKTPVKSQDRLFRGILLAGAFPLFLLGSLLNLPLLIAGKLILWVTISDPHFLQSVKFVIGMSLAPVYITGMSLFLGALTGVTWYIFLFIIPLTGILAYDYFDLLMRPPRPESALLLIGKFIPSH